ncbi:ABC transporter substrate-binding protein [Streptomyces candidus]|uniref:Iron complex transport system substrate-binding protein n=1 Tax=Streptomyces candidus TaxID=67283 RepID=A0A7X0HEB7_9ACTN|nr:iron-siderophore ABC transporter substrate-binding protein [Streptomyces candidus]MBB6434722.1 iron complex transport system substrate-binding protein [Streptomyces candidus]GHH35644.1 ABC transporter substrate-binding protein [Streptomyces candidus]
MSSNLTPRARLTAVAAVTLASALTLSACGSDDSGSGKGSGSGTQAKNADQVAVTDATGAEVKVPAAPKSVVVLSEMDLDSALALGVKPVGLTAGRGQKGAPGYLADQAKGIPVVGAVTGPDIEKVIQAKPDLILAGQLADKQVLAQLQKVAPTVVTIDKKKDWKKSFELSGKVLGKSNEAAEFLKGYDAKLAEVKTSLGKNANASVSVARYSAKGTAVMQQGVFISDVVKELGFKRPGIQNEKGQGHSTPLSDEDIKQIDADWLFIGTLSSQGKDAKPFAELKKKPAYQQLDAVEKGHVTEIDGSKWTSLGGAQAAMSVLDDIKKAMAAK